LPDIPDPEAIMMFQVWHDIRSHPAASILFLVLWVAVLVGTVVTWQIDAGGHSVGMNPGAIPFHLVLPLIVGALVAGWCREALRPFGKACALAGLVFGVIHFAVLLLVDSLWIPAVENGLSLPDYAAEAAGFAAAYALISVVLSMVGGEGRARLAYGLHRG
jgi:hypothetical protein